MDIALNRRSFAAAVLTASYSSAALSADPAPERPTPPASPEAVPAAPANDVVQPPHAEVAVEDLLLLALLRRYPMAELTAERAIGLRAGLRRNIEQGELLRRVGLANGDGPATVFRALR